MPIVFFLQFCWKISAQLGRVRILCAYIFISIHFNSFHFYSIQRDEKNETLRMITKKTKKNEKKRKISKITKYYEKKGKMLLKHHDSVIFYVKTVYFFIHAKNVFIAIFLFFVRFPFFRFFRFYSLFMNYDFLTK